MITDFKHVQLKPKSLHTTLVKKMLYSKEYIPNSQEWLQEVNET